MKANTVVIPAIAGTFLMTLFSNLASAKTGRDLSEPSLLAKMVKKALPKSVKPVAVPASQIAHYSIGILITDLYHNWCKQKKVEPSMQNGLIMGGIGGLAGIAIWKTVFLLHPAPPSVPERKFFNQLFLAHLVFGVGVAESKKWLNQNKNQHSGTMQES